MYIYIIYYIIFPRSSVYTIQSLRAFRRAAPMGVWSVVFWSWGVARGGLGGLKGVLGESFSTNTSCKESFTYTKYD